MPNPSRTPTRRLLSSNCPNNNSANYGVFSIPLAMVLLGMAPSEGGGVVTTPATTGVGAGWWWTTLFSVAGVTAIWVATAMALRLSRRLRWIGPASRMRLSRIVQVSFGAALLAALLLPYLLSHAPTAALVFSLVLAALTFPFIGGAADSQPVDREQTY